MGYTLFIYPFEVMNFVGSGGDLQDVPQIKLNIAEKVRLVERLEKYEYKLIDQKDGEMTYEKYFKKQPVSVKVFETMAAFSTPYWEKLDEIVFDFRMDVMELADSPLLAVYDPQTGEWEHGE